MPLLLSFRFMVENVNGIPISTRELVEPKVRSDSEKNNNHNNHNNNNAYSSFV